MGRRYCRVPRHTCPSDVHPTLVVVYSISSQREPKGKTFFLAFIHRKCSRVPGLGLETDDYLAHQSHRSEVAWASSFYAVNSSPRVVRVMQRHVYNTGAADPWYCATGPGSGVVPSLLAYSTSNRSLQFPFDLIGPKPAFSSD
jgi:hypothetical protein